MSGLNPVDVVEEDAADLLFPKDASTPDPNPFYTNLCDKCQTILIEPYVFCVECSQMFCLSCFSVGCETLKHRSDHSYTIRRDDFNLFTGSGWTAREEKVFLNIMHSYGVGNWDEISSAMKNKSPEQCRSHFYKFYFDGVFGKLGLSNDNAYMRHDVPYIVKSNCLEPPRSDINGFICKSMSGYRFSRGEFDVPYDNTAESILNNINLDQDLHNEEYEKFTTELNCAMFRAYNHRLTERYRRYKVVKDHGLILQRKTLAYLSKYSEVFHHNTSLGKFTAFMQLSEPISFDFLMESMKLFFETKRYLYRLYDLRQNGITSIAGGKLYHKLKAKRTNDERDRKLNDCDWRKIVWKGFDTEPQIVTKVVTVPIRRKAIPMDVVGLPGYDRLIDDEKSICSEFRMTPTAFLEYKRILVNANDTVGYLRLSDARRLIKIDVNKTREIYNLLIKNGYINAQL